MDWLDCRVREDDGCVQEIHHVVPILGNINRAHRFGAASPLRPASMLPRVDVRGVVTRVRRVGC